MSALSLLPAVHISPIQLTNPALLPYPPGPQGLSNTLMKITKSHHMKECDPCGATLFGQASVEGKTIVFTISICEKTNDIITLCNIPF